MISSVPAWVRIADGIAGALIALALWIVLTNRASAGILAFLWYVSLPGVLYALVSLLVLRHVLFPAPSIAARLREGWSRFSGRPAWGSAVRAFAATRLMVFVVSLFAVAAIGIAPDPGFRVSREQLVDLPARFDAGWYGDIALDGYDTLARADRQRNLAFFPAMPLLMRTAGYAFGVTEESRPRELRMARALWTGVLISLACFLGALVYLARLGTAWIGAPAGEHAVLLLAAYPFAFIFNAPYTEGLFLLATLGAVQHFHRGEWWAAAGWGLVTGLTRPNGFLLTVPLALLVAGRAWRTRDVRAQAAPLAAAAMPVAGMLLFTVYLFFITGTWFAWSLSHQAWGRSFQLGPIAGAWALLRQHGPVDVALMQPFNTLNACAFLFAFAMTWHVWRRIGAVWAIYVLITIVPPLLMGGALSMGRLTATLFPIFLALAAILPSRAVPNWAAAFAMLQGLGAALFFTWRQLY